MKRVCLAFGVALAIAASLTATAVAVEPDYTAGQAYTAAQQYADNHFSGGPELYACDASGKNKAGEAQWYCWGYFTSKGGEWKVNVGPYGEITYAKE
jgi:hypothetical protein